MSLSFDKICRTCLCSGAAMLSLLDHSVAEATSSETSSIAIMLKSFTSVKISDSDGLPSKVCLGCISDINRAYSFKIKCENAEETLKQYLSQQNDTSQSTVVEIKKFDVDGQKEELHSKNNNRIKDEKLFSEEIVSEIQNDDVIVVHEEEEDVEMDHDEFLANEDSVDAGARHELYILHEAEDNSDSPSSNDKVLLACSVCCRTFETKEEFTEHSDQCGNNYVVEEKKTNKKSVKNKQIKEPNKCPHCPVDFVHKKNLDKHIEKSHKHLLPEIKTATEERKKDELSSDTEDNESIESNTEIVAATVIKPKIAELPESPFRCSRCNAGFVQEKSLIYHIKLNKCTEKQFECHICKRVFISRRNFSRHMKSHSNKIYSCSKCSKTFSRQDKLNAHTRIAHDGVTKNQCPFCSKVFTMLSTLKDHVRIHNGEKPFLCSICGKGFSQSTNLKQHIMRHTKTKPHKCNQCGYSFVSKGELNAHVRKHTGDHPFVCDTCGSGFTTSSSLVKHKRIHTGERPYACEFCPMRFTALGTLKNHRRTHTGEKPFVCKYCDRGFAQRSDCVSHMRTHTGERPYICSICGLSFPQSGTLKSHSRTHLRENRKRKADDENSNGTTSSTEKGDADSHTFNTPDELQGEIL